jgi:hypothetical protein
MTEVVIRIKERTKPAENEKPGAKWFDIGDAKVRVASKELLIQVKNEVTPLRPKDVLDVQELSRLIEEESR